MRIRGDALELALRVVLSCPCPVTPEQEREVYRLAQALPMEATCDYADVLAVFGDADTPFHRLAEFVTWMAPAGEEPLIERHHVLRANASTYHWRHAVSTLPASVCRVGCLSSWLPAHLVLPVRLELDTAGESQGAYEYPGSRIVLSHLFLPPEFDITVHEWWAVHFAAVLGPLTPAEHRLLVDLTEANHELALHRTRVSVIDYRDFELQGDNAAFCARRHAAYWGST